VIVQFSTGGEVVSIPQIRDANEKPKKRGFEIRHKPSAREKVPVI
jgi:hypothetical protein